MHFTVLLSPCFFQVDWHHILSISLKWIAKSQLLSVIDWLVRCVVVFIACLLLYITNTAMRNKQNSRLQAYLQVQESDGVLPF